MKNDFNSGLSKESVPLAAPAPGRPDPIQTEAARTRRYLLPGFGILVLCELAGEWLKALANLALPGNILGLFILLGLLGTGVVPLHWVAATARLLLWLLPFLFVPVFVFTMHDKVFWLTQGRALVSAAVIGTVLLWAGVGHLSQGMLKKRMKAEG